MSRSPLPQFDFSCLPTVPFPSRVALSVGGTSTTQGAPALRVGPASTVDSTPAQVQRALLSRIAAHVPSDERADAAVRRRCASLVHSRLDFSLSALYRRPSNRPSLTKRTRLHHAIPDLRALRPNKPLTKNRSGCSTLQLDRNPPPPALPNAAAPCSRAACASPEPRRGGQARRRPIRYAFWRATILPRAAAATAAAASSYDAATAVGAAAEAAAAAATTLTAATTTTTIQPPHPSPSQRRNANRR